MPQALSEMQLLCLNALADGLSYDQIADNHQLQLDEVRRTIDSLRTEFNARTDEQLVAIAIRSGQIS